jgi:15-cis-phytoene synthase
VNGFAPPRAGNTRHLVWLYHEASRRDGMTALLALEREIAASTRADLDHAVAHARLDWWQGEIQRLAAGQPEHPLCVRLLAALRERRAPAPNFEPLVEAMRWAVACTAFEDRAEIGQCFDAWSGTVFVTAANLAPLQLHTSSLQAIRETGIALREVEALIRLRADAMLGRVHLPLAELDALGLDHLAVTRSPWDPRLAAHIGDRLRLCARTLRAAPATLSREDRTALRSVMVWIALGLRRAAPTASPLPGAPGAPREPPR